MRASRAFEPGDTVLREAPSITWPHGNPDELISRFLSSSAEVQTAVLDMAAPDPSGLDFGSEHVEARAARAAERSEHAERLAAGYDGARAAELFAHLFLIGDTNAHAFEERVGLFPVAAKANHSCEPNCGHTTRVGGEMHYFATRRIEAGDEILISYLDRVWSRTREDRRRTLLVQKLFFCNCPRCVRMDSSMPLEESAQSSQGAERTAPQQLARLECAAAGCSTECPECVNDGRSPHAPCPHLAGQAVTAYLACCAEAAEASKRGLRVASAATTALGRQIGKRYVRWAVLQFGEGDKAVACMLRSCA